MFKKRPTDEELISAIQSGDPIQLSWAVSHIEETWFGSARNAFLLPLSFHITEEVFQDALLVLIYNIRKGKYKRQSTSKLKSYFLRIFKICYFNYKKGDKRPPMVQFEVSQHDTESAEKVDDEYLENVKSKLNSLSEECQELILLRSNEFTYPELVEKFGISIATIKRKVAACKEKLYLLLNEARK